VPTPFRVTTVGLDGSEEEMESVLVCVPVAFGVKVEETIQLLVGGREVPQVVVEVFSTNSGLE